MVAGSGWLFTSRISHYTYRLSSILAEEFRFVRFATDECAETIPAQCLE